VLGSDTVGRPQILVVILSIPSAVLSCEMVDVIKVVIVKEVFKLTIASHVDSRVRVSISVRQIDAVNLVPSAAQRCYQVRSDEPGAAGYEYCVRLYVITSTPLSVFLTDLFVVRSGQ